MRSFIGSSGRDCVLSILFILFNFLALMLGFLKVICYGCVIMTPPTLNLHIGRRTNLILIEPNIILKQPV